MTPRTPRRTSPQPNPTPAVLTDPHLAALLLYVSGTADDDDGQSAADFAATLADARELLTSQPLTSAFSGQRRRPSVDEQVRVAVATKITGTSEPFRSTVARLLRDAMTGDERDTIATTRGDLRMLLSDHIDAALLRGACVMYCLLKDGAR